MWARYHIRNTNERCLCVSAAQVAEADIHYVEDLYPLDDL